MGYRKDIMDRKYDLRGFNNPSDYFYGLKLNKDRYATCSKKKRNIFFVALPEHGNLGDQAIAVAINEFLARVCTNDHIIRVFYNEVISNLLLIKRHIKKGDILILIGGGNMGYEYFAEEEVRRLTIKAFPNNRIIIFPQTIDYGHSKEGLKEFENSKVIYGRHKDLHIFAREQASYDVMKEAYTKNQVYLVPDIVLSLSNVICSDCKREEQVLVCVRKDKEGIVSKEDSKTIKGILERNELAIQYTDTVLSYIPYITNENLRKKLVVKKIDQFASSKLIITDRLHGLIFSVITNTPCIVFGNYNHKIISTYQTWLKDVPYIRFAKKAEEVETFVKELSMVKPEKVDVLEKYNTLEALFNKE